MIGTKNYFTNESTHIERGMKPWNDLGYFPIDIPWNDVYTAGWQESRPDIWGYENKLITSSQPEYFAPDNIVKSTGGLPSIDINNPIYAFDRSQHTYSVF